MNKVRLIVFAKAPVAGFAKTRLIPALGSEGAARLAKHLLLNTLQNGLEANFDVMEFCTSPSPEDKVWQNLALLPAISQSVVWSAQGEGDLGARLARASRRAINNGEAVLLIGTDCPQLSPAILRQAADRLEHADAVIIPASDGGYTLLGLNRFHKSLFKNINWSTETVFTDTVQRLKNMMWSVEVMAELHDIDLPSDLCWLPNGWLPNN
jgi:rSAM/selenodomain-associated transferase 1